MTSGLKKPSTNVFRNFLYLDGGAVLNTLSAIEGGDIDDVLTPTHEEGAGELGGELRLPGASVRGGKKSARRLEEEIHRKRTEHSAATKLLRLVHDADAIGVLGTTYGDREHAELEEHMMLELRGRIRIHPLHQAVSAARAWLGAAATFGVSKSDAADVRQTVALLESLSGGRSSDTTFLAFVEHPGWEAGYRLVVPVKERNLLVPLDEFAGSATFITQVDRKLEGEDELLAIRLIRNAPQLPLEREGIIEALPDFVAGIRELGIDTSVEDFIFRQPAVVLRPIWIFK